MHRKRLFFTAVVFALFCSSSVSFAREPGSSETLLNVASPSPKPALPANKLRVQSSNKPAAIHYTHTLQPWPNDFQTSYSLFDDDYRFIDVDLSVGLRPKRIMSFEAQW